MLNPRVDNSCHRVVLIALGVSCGVWYRGDLTWERVVGGGPKEASIKDIIAGLV